MTGHEHTLTVERPVRTVYDQWTQFSSYPEFMHNVDEVRQIDAAMTHWHVTVGGVQREFDAAILEQKPDEIISWASTSGPRQAGVVTFESLEPSLTQVTLRLDFEPHGITERVGDAFGVVSSSVEKSLEKFKEFIEGRGSAEGSWRGSIERGETVSEPGLDLRDEPVHQLPGDAAGPPGHDAG